MAQKNECELFAENALYGAAFREGIKNKMLTASRCRKCGAAFIPPRPICPGCRGTDIETIPVTGKGKLIAFTVITAAPPLMIEEGYNRENPYCSGVVELDGGAKVTARILGVDVRNPANIKTGTPVELDFQEAAHNGEKKCYLAFRAIK